MHCCIKCTQKSLRCDFNTGDGVTMTVCVVTIGFCGGCVCVCVCVCVCDCAVTVKLLVMYVMVM